MVPKKKVRLKKLSYGFHLSLRRIHKVRDFGVFPSLFTRTIIGNCIQLTRVKPHPFPPRRRFATGFGLAPGAGRLGLLGFAVLNLPHATERQLGSTTLYNSFAFTIFSRMSGLVADVRCFLQGVVVFLYR